MKTSTRKWLEKKNLEEGCEQLDILVAHDFRVEQFSEYHFRVNEELDIWPTTRKWRDVRTGEMGFYTDLEFVHKYPFRAPAPCDCFPTIPNRSELNKPRLGA